MAKQSYAECKAVEGILCPLSECTGCAACFNSCPEDSIRMQPDAEGFSVPVIEPERCTQCGLCRRSCPLLNRPEVDDTRLPDVYACWNLNGEVRRQSASGGVFSVFADHILEQGGTVFGAAFDAALILSHTGVASHESLGKLRSSKYMQSHIGYTLKEVRRLLVEGKPVLFVGTPCQVAGLYSFLGKNKYRGQLLTCDLICYGVPPQGIFQSNLEYLSRKYKAAVTSILFRNKEFGAANCTVGLFEDGRKRVLAGHDIFFGLGFGLGLFFRNCCYDCRFSTPSRISDITLGDFWGIDTIPEFVQESKRGISLVLLHSEAGHTAFNACRGRMFSKQRTWAEATRDKRAQMITGSAKRNEKRDRFFQDWAAMPLEELLRKYFPKRWTIGEAVRCIIGSERFLILKQILKR